MRISAPIPVPASPRGYRGDLILFMAIAFILSWACWFTAVGLGGSAMTAPTVLPYLFGAFGPLVGALVIRIRRVRRGEPVPEHAVRSRRKGLLWALLLLVLASATVLSAALLAHVAGGPAVSLEDAKDVMKDAGGPAAFLVSMVISGPLSEEPGWRGTAYPRMRASMGRLQVGLVLGVLWAVWHLPLFFIDGTRFMAAEPARDSQHRDGTQRPDRRRESQRAGCVRATVIALGPLHRTPRTPRWHVFCGPEAVDALQPRTRVGWRLLPRIPGGVITAAMTSGNGRPGNRRRGESPLAGRHMARSESSARPAGPTVGPATAQSRSVRLPEALRNQPQHSRPPPRVVPARCRAMSKRKWFTCIHPTPSQAAVAAVPNRPRR
jgi:membrane protease YdiL (CAAX protease family)